MDEARMNELNETLKGIWDSLTDEQKEKAKACKTMDELTALAGKEGVELSDEVLDAVAGGYVFYGKLDGGETGFQAIRDSDGKVLGGNEPLDFQQATVIARAHGQSTDVIEWDQLNRLRKTGSIAEPKSGC